MAGEYPDWRSVHAELTAREPATLDATELDTLAECCFWLDRPQEAIEVRGRAYRAHVEVGDHEGAALAAWQQYYDHALVGELALANGWLERLRGEAAAARTARTAGFLAIAEADHLLGAGSTDQAVAVATEAVAIGRETGDADLLAMAQQKLGRIQLDTGRTAEGIAAMEEAMVAVVNGELRPLFTGWVFCDALSACHDLADLDRATQWSDAADRWCAGLHDGRLYPGLCRLHVVELQGLRGAWADAMAEAETARDELLSHDPRFAGEAYYLIGELHRLRGEIDLAEDHYTQAHQLGRLPQPGLALVRLSQGRVDAAVRALELALDPAPAPPARRAELLAALTTALIAIDDVAGDERRVDQLATVSDEVDSDYLGGLAAMARAAVATAATAPETAFRDASRAVAVFRDLGLPYEQARAQVVRATAAGRLGDDDARLLDLEAARSTFARLGAEPDRRAIDAALGETTPSPLSDREVEVVRLLARGLTNKEMAAELHLSEHTVARHLANIYTKLGVNSRAAATAYAYEHALV